MLDQLSPQARHVALLVLCTAFTGGAEAVSQLNPADLSLPTWSAPIFGAAMTALLAWATSLTRQYGVGSVPVDKPLPEPTTLDPEDAAA